MKKIILFSFGLSMCVFGSLAAERNLSDRFSVLAAEDRAFTGPLFWLHGTETAERLERMVDVVADSGQGILTIESRYHNDWMGPRWWSDLDTVLARSRRNGLKVIIFDDPWWPSQAMRGRVPEAYGCHAVAAQVVKGAIPSVVSNEICRIRCSEVSAGVFRPGEGDTTVVFTDVRHAEKVNEGGVELRSVNGLDPAAVDWFLATVYDAHYRRYKEYFDDGTVVGYFFDEPETHGDWGPALRDLLAERGEPDLAKMLLAYRFALDDAAEGARLRHRFLDARAEAWGRTMYGRTSAWCKDHGVFSSGHFMEHANEFYSQKLNAGDVMMMEKYVEVPGVDLVCRQYYPRDQLERGERSVLMGQMPKVSSSTAHAHTRLASRPGLNWCEIFGGYGQELTSFEMKWLCDWHQVRGCSFLIPHSFNPKAPHDNDYPPYFYNDGKEPRYPIFRVWADYNNRCALMLSGGEHVCAIAQVLPGQSRNTSRALRPEPFTFAIQDSQMDCDWVRADDLAAAAIETDARTARPALRLPAGDERYPVLALPAAELVDFALLEKALEFARRGGVVIGYAIKPKDTYTRGKTPADVKAAVDEIFAQPASRFFAAEPTPAELVAAVPERVRLEGGVVSPSGLANLHVCHYAKDGYEIYFVANQDATMRREATFRCPLPAGELEVWDPMRGTCVRAVSATEDSRAVLLSFEPGQALFLVRPPTARARTTLPGPLDLAAMRPVPLDGALRVTRTAVPPKGAEPDVRGPFMESVVSEGTFTLEDGPSGARVIVKCVDVRGEPSARITVNGEYAGGFIGEPMTCDITRFVKPGVNRLRIEPFACGEVKIFRERVR